MGVVDAGKMNAGAPALDRFGFVQQHTDAHLLEQRHGFKYQFVRDVEGETAWNCFRALRHADDHESRRRLPHKEQEERGAGEGKVTAPG